LASTKRIIPKNVYTPVDGAVNRCVPVSQFPPGSVPGAMLSFEKFTGNHIQETYSDGPAETFMVCGEDDIENAEMTITTLQEISQNRFIEGTGTCSCN